MSSFRYPLVTLIALTFCQLASAQAKPTLPDGVIFEAGIE